MKLPNVPIEAIQVTDPLTYGSMIKLRQPQKPALANDPRVNKWLHSHEIKFGRGGFYSVTGYNREDLGNYWQILE